MPISSTKVPFGEWLDKECKKRGWSHAELGRRAGFSEARVSQVCRGWKPGIKFCMSIAEPLGLSPYDVLRLAGLALPVKLDDPMKQELLEAFSALSPEERRLAIRIIRVLRNGKR
jgi:transcriptional regulator with XRE-family HTH domain